MSGSARRMVRPVGVTILHLSDLQFGVNNRFLGKDAIGLPSERQTLDGSLLADLRGLADKHELRPDLVIVTGDLAEWAMPAELAAARSFVKKLGDQLHLTAEQILVIPGNHDINRDLCSAYFSSQAAEGLAPERPYAAKWKHFIKCFSAGDAAFYASVPRYAFAEKQPWTLFELPELKVVVAGLNSTMAESHLEKDHFGWVGDDQLGWFAEQMKTYRTRGWLCVGAGTPQPATKVRGRFGEPAGREQA